MQNARAAADVLSGGNLHPQGIAIRLFFQGPRMIYGPKADGHLGDSSAQDTPAPEMKWKRFRNLRRRPAKPSPWPRPIAGPGAPGLRHCRCAGDIREQDLRLVLCEAPAGARQAADDAASLFGVARVESAGRRAGRPCQVAPCDLVAIAQQRGRQSRERARSSRKEREERQVSLGFCFTFF
jgi:hypothetical protein